MPSPIGKEMPRRVLPVIYVLDTSGSMEGDRIAAVNVAMKETVEVLKEVANENAKAEIKIGVLTFNSTAQWMTKELVYVEDFFWNNLKAGGLTEVSLALEALFDQMSRSELLVSDTGFLVPVVIFMSDGEPTDPGKWEPKLKWLIDNNTWFRCATKIALAVGQDADKGCLAKIVGSNEAVAEVTDLETLKKLIKVVSVTASQLNAKSRTTADASNGGDIVKKAVDDSDDPSKITVGSDTGYTPGSDDDPWKNWNKNSADNGKWS